jgi:hypothetical protein|tara:strand:+ start:230 stop:577 length:348 start_codon:yes stop_codon:yes gene_type:complete
MPTYTFYNSKTKKQWDDMMSNDERVEFLEDNPHINQVPGGFAFVGDHIMGVGPKVDGGFTENMQRIAAAHPDSPMTARFGGSTQTHKEIKTRDIISKHAKRVARDGFSANIKKTL